MSLSQRDILTLLSLLGLIWIWNNGVVLLHQWGTVSLWSGFDSWSVRQVRAVRRARSLKGRWLSSLFPPFLSYFYHTHPDALLWGKWANVISVQLQTQQQQLLNNLNYAQLPLYIADIINNNKIFCAGSQQKCTWVIGWFENAGKKLLCAHESFADYKLCHLALALFISLSRMYYTECQISIFETPPRYLFMALMKYLCGGVHAVVLQLTYVDPLAIALHQQQDKHVKGNKVDDEHISTPCRNLWNTQKHNAFV